MIDNRQLRDRASEGLKEIWRRSPLTQPILARLSSCGRAAHQAQRVPLLSFSGEELAAIGALSAPLPPPDRSNFLQIARSPRPVILTGGLDFHSFSSTYKPTRLTHATRSVNFWVSAGGNRTHQSPSGCLGQIGRIKQTRRTNITQANGRGIEMLRRPLPNLTRPHLPRTKNIPHPTTALRYSAPHLLPGNGRVWVHPVPPSPCCRITSTKPTSEDPNADRGLSPAAASLL